ALRPRVHGPLAADAEGDPGLLRDPREIAVDAKRRTRPAGHAGDDERRGEAFSEPARRRVDLVEREIGERVVDELDLLQERRLLRGLDVFTKTEVEMRLLPLGNA